MSTPPSFLTEEMRSQALGVESEPATLEVEKGAIASFAEAIGDSNPAYTDEAAARHTPTGSLVAPPTFLRSMRAVRPDLPFDIPFERVLDGGSAWEYFQPVRDGDTITAVATITDIVERTGRLGLMLILTTRITYSNQFGEVAATQTNTSIRY